MMKLKVTDKVEKLTNVIEISNVEYSEGDTAFRIWDTIGDMALVKCKSVREAEDCVRDLWRADRAELLDAEVDWDHDDEDDFVQ